MPSIGPYASRIFSSLEPLQHRVVHLHVGDVRLQLVGRVVDRHAEDLEAPRAVLLLKLDEPGNLDLARAAPRRPEVEQDDLALVVGQLDVVLRRPSA